MDQSDSYRSTLVVDGDDNVIECQLTLVDYAGRPGGDLRDLYIDFHLSPDQNRRLVSLLQDFSHERSQQLFFQRADLQAALPYYVPHQAYSLRSTVARDTLEKKSDLIPTMPQAKLPFQVYHSLGSGMTCGAIGVDPSLAVKQDLTPREIFAIYQESQQGAQPPMDDDCDQDGEGPIKRDHDDFADEEQKDMDNNDDEPVSPWKVFDVKRKAMTHMTGHFEEVANPDLERVTCKYQTQTGQNCQEKAVIRQIFCENHLIMSTTDYHAEKEKSRLRRSLDGSSERMNCRYRAGGGLACTTMAKKRQIYCAHHLYVASTKHLADQEKSLMKRATSDVEIFDPEVDYESLLKMEISPAKKRTKSDD